MTETRGGYADAGDPLLEQLAQRLEGDPTYMASVLEAYRRQEGKSRDAQQQQLGLSRLAFVRLALCRRPDLDQATFRAQVEEIAHYTGAAPASLVQLIRQVDALASMDARTLEHGIAPAPTARPVPAPTVLAMMAARDRIAETPETYGQRKPLTDESDAAEDPAAAASDDEQNPSASSAESERPTAGREESRDDSTSDLSAQSPQEADDDLA